MLSTMRISEILQPAPNTKPAVGNNISSRNPDVEVMALTLSTMPLNMDGFNVLDGGRGWVNSKFLILSVGAPGFSSVPYTHNKKSTEKEAGKRLYEVAEDGSTRLFSYEKGRTNKDRGCRVASAIGEDCVERDITASLAPGMCIGNFTRSDNYDSSAKFIVGDVSSDTLAEYSVVYMQIGSSNSEQAQKGRLLKVRKVMVPETNHLDWQQCIRMLPSNASEFRDINDVEKNFSIRENIDSRNRAAFYQFMASKEAFTNHEDNQIVLCDLKPGVEVAHMQASLLDRILPNASDEQKLKFFNVALSTGSVRVLLRTVSEDDFMRLSATADKYANRVVGLHIDYNIMFGLEVLSEINFDEDIAPPDAEWNIKRGVDFLMWSKQDYWGCPNTANRNEIAFSLSLDLSSPSEDVQVNTNALLDKNCATTYYALRLHMNNMASFDALFDQVAQSKSAQCLLTVELRPGNRALGSHQKKRKRCEMSLEEDE